MRASTHPDSLAAIFLERAIINPPPGEVRNAVIWRAMLSRSCSSLITALLVLGSSATAFATELGAPNPTPASDESESSKDFDVGARLVATNDVKLREVSLSKGARVVVRGVEAKRGRAASFDVELADGQVLKHVDAATVRRSFALDA